MAGRAQWRAAGGLGRRDPQRRHAVPGRFGAGRAAGPQPRRAPAVASDLQDPARQGRTPAGRSPAPATRTGATATRKATSPSTCGPCRTRRRAISPARSPTSSARCASWSPTGRRCCERLEAATRQLETAPASVAAATCCASRRLPRWLEQDNFTFLGAREFELTGDAETGDLASVDGSGLGVLRDAERAGAAPRQRAGGDDARGAPLLLRAVAAHHHQGQRRQPRAPARAHGLHRHQDLPRATAAQGRDPLRRPVHVAGLCAARPARSRLLRHKVDTVLAASGYPPASHAGKALLNILDTFPRDELFQIGAKAAAGMERGHSRPRDAAARARVRARRPLRPVRVGAASMSRATATTRRCASASARCWRRPTRAASSAFYPYFPEGPLVRVQFIVGRYDGRDAACRRGRAGAQDRRDRAHLGGPAGRCHLPRRASDARRRCRPSTARPSPPATRRPSRPSGRWRTSSASSGWARSSRSSSISIASPACPRAASTPRSIRWARRSPSPSACRCWRTWASRPSTSAPITSGRALPTASAT